MDTLTINSRKLKNFLSKFQDVEFNSENYSIGGGLIGGMSNRNFDAKNDQGKLTIDQATRKIADIFGVDKVIVKEIIEREFRLEWHHAGFLPKSYGGGMRKIFYVNSEQMVSVVKNFEEFLAKDNLLKEEKKLALEKETQKRITREHFAGKFGKRFCRVVNVPLFSVIEKSEMNGKYGWFDSSGKDYKLPEYHSGVAFDNNQDKEHYLSI